MNSTEAIRIAREARRLDGDTDPYEQPDWVKAHKAAWRRLTGKEKPTGLKPGGRKSRRKPPKRRWARGASRRVLGRALRVLLRNWRTNEPADQKGPIRRSGDGRGQQLCMPSGE